MPNSRKKFAYRNGYAPEWMKDKYAKPKRPLPDLKKLRELPAYEYRELIAPHLVSEVDDLIRKAKRENRSRIGMRVIALKFGISFRSVNILVRTRAKKLGIKLNLKRGYPWPKSTG